MNNLVYLFRFSMCVMALVEGDCASIVKIDLSSWSQLIIARFTPKTLYARSIEKNIILVAI